MAKTKTKTKTKKLPNSFSVWWSKNIKVVLVFIIIFGLIGLSTLLVSHASTCTSYTWRNDSKSYCVKNIETITNYYLNGAHPPGQVKGIEQDGIYDNQTKSNVIRFQTAQDLDIDGVVGPQTWAKLCQYSTKFYNTSDPLYLDLVNAAKSAGC